MNEGMFCCPRMSDAVNDLDLPIVFEPKYREYGIRVLDGGSSSLGITFCPWCGEQLPDSLRNEWFERLEKMGIDPYGKGIPAEFMDERWYRN